MKIFWAVLAAVILAGVGYVAVAARASSARGAAQAEQVGAAREMDPKQAGAGAVSAAELEVLKKQQQELADRLAESKKQAEAIKAAAVNPPTDRVNSLTEARQQEAEVVAKAADAAKTEPAKEAVKDEARPAAEQPNAAVPEKVEAQQPQPASNGGFSISDGSIAPVGVTGTPTAQGAPKAVVATVKQDTPAMFDKFEVIPAKIEKKEDGSMMVDGKYLIKGEGTAEKPYVVPWEVLTSVEETFDPTAGKKRLPERVTMLDGKVVKFAGYIAFPLMMKETKECLSMLNQWDGCCIGVPPTPYDAVEVALTRTIKGEERFTTSGVVTGTFRVKPYLQGDWLIGLYVMEGADLKSRDFGGSAGN